jgi:hypothetical protein
MSTTTAFRSQPPHAGEQGAVAHGLRNELNLNRRVA